MPTRDNRNEPNRNLHVTGFLLACIMYHRFPIFFERLHFYGLVGGERWFPKLFLGLNGYHERSFGPHMRARPWRPGVRIELTAGGIEGVIHVADYKISSCNPF